jgi:hypothetical protein
MRCTCKDCLDTFYDRGNHHYTNDHALYHHSKCNHITEKDLDKIESEDEVWDSESEMYVIKTVTHWKGYRCTCKQVVMEEE